jgi:ATP-binding cassette, subfamily B (MDR/TAP), member 1
MFFSFALLFWYGAKLVASGEASFVNMYMAMFAVILGAAGVTQVSVDIGAQTAGQQAAARVFALSNTPYKYVCMT